MFLGYAQKIKGGYQMSSVWFPQGRQMGNQEKNRLLFKSTSTRSIPFQQILGLYNVLPRASEMPSIYPKKVSCHRFLWSFELEVTGLDYADGTPLAEQLWNLLFKTATNECFLKGLPMIESHARGRGRTMNANIFRWTSSTLSWSRLSFPATGPRTLELILRPREAQRIIDFDTFLKGFRRVFEGVLKGPRLTPSKNPSKTLQKPFRDPFRDPSETFLKLG